MELPFVIFMILTVLAALWLFITRAGKVSCIFILQLCQN